MTEEEWIKNLSIPHSIYPGLRDLRIQFIGLLEFDLTVGPVAHILELQRGSSYIKKLKNFQTLSEVYAGVARSPQHSQSTLEEDIAIFRYETDSDTDITTVLLISCIPNSNLDPIRELGQKALFRSRGKPELLGEEIAKILREKFKTDKMVISGKSKSQLLIVDENRIGDGFDSPYIKGFMIIDLESKMVDIRNFPRSIDDTDLDGKDIISYFDAQLVNIQASSSTTFWYHNIPLLASKVREQEIYVIIVLPDIDFMKIQELNTWFIPLTDSIGHEWKEASQFELQKVISLFDEIPKRNPPQVTLASYSKILMRNQRIKPNKSKRQRVDIEPPRYIPKEIWDKMMELDGNSTLSEVAKDWNVPLLQVITILEWARVRNLIEFLQEISL